jgi:hypothetical protein
MNAGQFLRIAVRTIVVVAITVAAVGIIDRFLSPGPRIIIKGVRTPPPPAPPATARARWELDAVDTAFTCESGNLRCALALKDAPRWTGWQYWGKLRGAAYRVGTATVTLKVSDAAGGGVLLFASANTPFTLSAGDLSLPGAVLAYDIDLEGAADAHGKDQNGLEFVQNFK